MATHRAPDPLAASLRREQARVLACLGQFGIDRKAAVLAEAARIVRALADAEAEVLHPAFSRVRLRADIQQLLDDSRDDRAEQLSALERLARRRAPRLRKLAAVQAMELVRIHGERLTTVLVPVLASQLAAPVFRCIVQAFVTRYDAALAASPAASRGIRTQLLLHRAARQHAP
jgi:hypothetical protein